MKKLLLLAALCASFPVLAQTAYTVNGKVISQNAQKKMMGVLAQRGVSDVNQQAAMAKQVLTEQTVIQQLAAKNKLDTPEIEAQVEEYKTQLLLNALLKKNVFNTPFQEYELKQVYQQNKDVYDPNEVKVSHILVSSDVQARAIMTRLKNGESFEALAKECSLDKHTADKGGELPFTNVRQITIPGFAEAALALGRGAILPIPFKSQMGYHVMRLDDKREVPFPTYEQLKGQIQRSLMQAKTQEFVTTIVADAKIGALTPNGNNASTQVAKATPKSPKQQRLPYRSAFSMNKKQTAEN